MKRALYACAIVAGAMLTASAMADDGGLLDFEDPITTDFIDAPNPYHDTTWSTAAGDGLSHLGVMNVEWYNAEYGASLSPISGEQVGWSRFGEDNISVSFPGNVIVEQFFLTPWFGFGPQSMTIDFYDDGVLVGSRFTGNLGNNNWVGVNVFIEADQMIFRSGGNAWWLIDDLSWSKVPAPGALALFGLAVVGARRSRTA